MLKTRKLLILAFLVIFMNASPAFAATSIPFTINLSEAVNVTGTPRIAVDVGGVTRYATYTSGTGTSALIFTYAMVAGDVDLDGVTVSSPIDLNGGTIKDLAGNDLSPLTFTLPNTSNVKVNYPSLGMDFIYDADGRYTLNGTVYNDFTSFLTAAGGTFSRSSIGTYFDSTGTLQTAASNIPRFDYDPTTLAAKGILIEESRTNSVQNAEQVGFIAGTPGTTAGNWIVSPNTANGLTRTIVGTGTLNGIKYFDIRWAGTSTSTQAIQMDPQLPNVSAASSGQTWTGSAYVQIIAGSIPSPANLNITVIERNSTSSYLIATSAIIPNVAPWKRYSVSRTFNNAATAYAHLGIRIDSLNVGTIIDVTIRIAAPQLELGSFATSYIPTTTTAVTRAADILSIPTGGWYNPTESTVFAQYDVPNKSSIAGVFSLNDGSQNNKTDLRTNGGMITSIANINQENQTVAANSSTTNKVSKGIILNNIGGSANGSAVITDTSVGVPTVNKLQIGGLDNSISYGMNGTLQKLKYYPLRSSNTQLQLLTQ